jgi:hypothetical protein
MFVVLIEYVSIFLGQFVFSSSFPTLRKILVTNGQRNGIPELCYVLKISIKFSSSQYWCIYRGPRVHGVGLGDLDTSVYKNLRKVWKNRCGQTTEQPSNRDGVQRTDFVMTGVSVLLVPDVQRSGPPAVVEKAGQERQEVGKWKKDRKAQKCCKTTIKFFFSFHTFLVYTNFSTSDLNTCKI